MCPSSGCRHLLPVQRGEGTCGAAASLLRPACGEKVAGRPDEGQLRLRTRKRLLDRRHQPFPEAL
ncbi:hypothetical protein CN204_36930, partial [Sinorhizobium meliloti]